MTDIIEEEEEQSIISDIHDDDVGDKGEAHGEVHDDEDGDDDSQASPATMKSGVPIIPHEEEVEDAEIKEVTPMNFVEEVNLVTPGPEHDSEPPHHYDANAPQFDSGSLHSSEVHVARLKARALNLRQVCFTIILSSF